MFLVGFYVRARVLYLVACIHRGWSPRALYLALAPIRTWYLGEPVTCLMAVISMGIGLTLVFGPLTFSRESHPFFQTLLFYDWAGQHGEFRRAATNGCHSVFGISLGHCGLQGTSRVSLGELSRRRHSRRLKRLSSKCLDMSLQTLLRFSRRCFYSPTTGMITRNVAGQRATLLFWKDTKQATSKPY